MSVKDESVVSLFGGRRRRVPETDDSLVSSTTLIGVEIEAERVVILNNTALVQAGWSIVSDGSLKNSGREFIFASPLYGTAITEALDAFFDTSNVVYAENPRAGVHIHVNWSDGATFESIHRLLAIVYCLEPAIFRLSDKGRKYCGYCSSLTELSDEELRTILTTKSKSVLLSIMNGYQAGSGGRYYGTNLRSLFKHGTVEFRYFPATSSKHELLRWINLVMQLRDAAIKCELDLPQLVTSLSTEDGIVSFVNEWFAFNDLSSLLLNNLDLRHAVSRVQTFSSLINIVPAKARKPAPAGASTSVQRLLKNRFPLVAQEIEGSIRRNAAIENVVETSSVAEAVDWLHIFEEPN